MTNAERRELEMLQAVAENARITQRSLSTRLGIALGLTNIYLRRLTRKGYIKCVGVQSNRLSYLITPKGIAEKARLTYQFMDYSLHLYREVRRHLTETLRTVLSSDRRRVAIYGTGEAAELAYLSLKEFGLEPVMVLDGREGGEFLGMRVQCLDATSAQHFDHLIVATLGDPESLIEHVVQQGVDRAGVVTLRPIPTDRAGRGAGE